jgi:uncharacterized membrane protein YeiH
MFEIAEYIGIIAFASSGFFVAARNHLDFLGTLISVFLTALGGGLIRDVVVDRAPYTFTHNEPALTILVVMIIMVVFRFHKRDSIENKPLFILSDSIGLISFSITGSLIAIEAGLNLTGVLALSFVTAVGGGIIRDVIINEIPFVLKTGFYGTIALLIGLTFYVLDLYEMINFSTMIMVFAAGIVLRLIAYYKEWAIPMI